MFVYLGPAIITHFHPYPWTQEKKTIWKVAGGVGGFVWVGRFSWQGCWWRVNELTRAMHGPQRWENRASFLFIKLSFLLNETAHIVVAKNPGVKSVSTKFKIVILSITSSVTLACFWVFLSFRVPSLPLNNNFYHTELLGGLNEKKFKSTAQSIWGQRFCVVVAVCHMCTHMHLHVKLPGVTDKLNI